ncbi:DUF1385 domain-containing protein [Dehalococcoidia bacterium]|nr:DUF1385 domain-containing protein [Dehalococcoidia bacterium]
MSETRTSYGGQAVLEGVMIRGKEHFSVSVRNPSGQIITRTKPVPNLLSSKLKQIPLLRGVITLAETLVLGMDALNYSSSIASGTEPEDTSKLSIISMLVISLTIAITLFFILPLLASKPFEGMFGNDITSNISEGIIRLIIFLLYISLIGLMQDIKRVYMYHGAEHMTVHAQENNEPLCIQNIRKYPTAHPRCGTAFLLTVMVVAIVIFTLIPREPMWLLYGSRIVLIPVIASISYEFIRLTGRYQRIPIFRVLSIPNLMLQSLTTKQPDDGQIKIAVAAMEATIKADEKLG